MNAPELSLAPSDGKCVRACSIRGGILVGAGFVRTPWVSERAPGQFPWIERRTLVRPNSTTAMFCRGPAGSTTSPHTGPAAVGSGPYIGRAQNLFGWRSQTAGACPGSRQARAADGPTRSSPGTSWRVQAGWNASTTRDKRRLSSGAAGAEELTPFLLDGGDKGIDDDYSTILLVLSG